MAGRIANISYQEIKALYGIENSKTDEDYQKEFSKYFFYANVCQHCSSVQKSTFLCDICSITSYCSDICHCLIQRFDHHQAFCEVLEKLMKDKNKSYIFKDCYISIMGVKTEFTEVIELELGRRLKPYEQNIFFYPRVCLICSHADPNKLASCPDCPHANFCDAHWFDKYTYVHIESNCSLFRNVFFMDQHWLVFKDLPLQRFVHALPHNERNINLPNSFIWFLEDFVKPYHTNMQLENDEVQKIVSTVFHRTLTLIYALEELTLTFSLKLQVHIICKRKFAQENFVEWEILLHWLPRLKNLKICFIGCQMPQQTFKMRLCAHCKGKTLEIEISNLCCKEYYGNSSHRDADVIVSYDVDTNTHRTWNGASSLFTSMKIPIVLTSLDKTYLRRAITKFVANPEQFKQIFKNPYKSLKEERFLSHISYSSHFMSIYPNLSPKICGVDNAIKPCHECDDCKAYEISKIVNGRMVEKWRKINRGIKNKLKRYQLANEMLKESQNKYLEYLDYARLTIENITQGLEKAASEKMKDFKIVEDLLKQEDDEDTTTFI